MADFEQWFVLPLGEMPTVRQVLECGGGTWICFPFERSVELRVGGGRVAWREAAHLGILDNRWWTIAFPTSRFAVVNPRPIESPMPTPEQVGESSRWRILCAHKPEGDACTLRTVNGQIEVMFDGDDRWVPLAPQWGEGMVAVREAT